MPKSDDADSEHDDAAKPPTSDETRPVAHLDNESREEKQEHHRPHWADRVIAVFTGLIFITYIASNYFACQQMSLTKGAMEQAKRDNAAAIQAQKQIAADALRISQENFHESLKSSDENLKRTLSEMRAQTARK